METWQAQNFAEGGIDAVFVQENFSHSHKCTDYHAPEVDRSIRWDDPEIGINWPLTQGEELILPDKDAAAPNLKEAEIYPWSAPQAVTACLPVAVTLMAATRCKGNLIEICIILPRDNCSVSSLR